MKILIAPDSFKGSLSANQVAEAMAKGVQQYDHTIEPILLPVADGGEGTMDVLIEGTGGHKKYIQVAGPLNQQIFAAYGVLGDEETVIIEIAEAAGLHRIDQMQLNPLRATSYGVGQLITAALNEGYRQFIIGLGGSATNDGGVGMLQALGIRFLNGKGQEVSLGGGALAQIEQINLEQFDIRIKESTFIIASDVDNPFIGPRGASVVFGPQKGADFEMIQQLDRNLHHLANKIEQTLDYSIHNVEGAGAAGGLGGAFQAFFPSTMKPGIHVVLEKLQFDDYVKDAVLVISGEGKIDAQTAFGKTPYGVAKAAKEYGVPTVLIGAIVEALPASLYEVGVVSAMSMTNGPMSTTAALSNTEKLIRQVTEQCMRLYFATTSK